MGYGAATLQALVHHISKTESRVKTEFPCWVRIVDTGMIAATMLPATVSVSLISTF